MSLDLSRRSLMRGLVNGAAVGVAIPFLDCFLDNHGQALAATGAPLPTRFGTFFWGLGLTPTLWRPTKVGQGWEVSEDLKSLDPIKHKVSVMSGFRVHLDGRANHQHWTGQGAVMTGLAPAKLRYFDAPTFDTHIAQTLGAGTRFRSLEITPFGNPALSYSTPTGGNAFNPPEYTPIGLYQRLFGAGFQDPNSGNWKPDPDVMLRQSVLSAVGEQRRALMAKLGTSDKQRLDQYFTSVRQMEEQLAVQLEKPAPAEACVVPKSPGESIRNGEVPTVSNNNKLMAELMAMALACNQTKVFNAVFTSATSELYLTGDSSIYHQHTHEEAIDAKLGYQPLSRKLAQASVNGYGDFLKALDAVKEGDGTLLDRSLVLGFSDTGNAKIHSTDDIPMLLAGGASGRHKGGWHIQGNGDPVSRVSLTAQQLVGMPVGTFGTGAMATSKPITEIMKA